MRRGIRLIEKKTRIVVALDVTSEEEALQVARDLNGAVDAIKIGYPLILNCGMDILKKVKEVANLPIIADLKVADIGNTAEMIVCAAVENGADYVIVQGFVGSDMAKTCLEVTPNIIMVTEMSHPGATEFIQKHTEELCKMAKEVGVAGIVAPATRPERLRMIRGILPNLTIFSPGVGAQGGKASEAVDAGADFLIIGRAIYQAQDPKNAVKQIIEEIKNG